MSIRKNMKVFAAGVNDKELGLISTTRANQSIDYVPYVCKIYLCGKKSYDDKGYCGEHSSPLRPGLPPFTLGSAPIVRKKAM